MVWQYNYVLKDHLGNTRVTFADTTGNGLIDPTIEIAQINHYYPFGLNMDGNWNGASPNVKNKYQYNDKELQTDFGLNWNDYGARMYDPAMARWTSIDPLAEKYYRWSPYNYCVDNPINYTDPTGMDAMPGKDRNEAEEYNNQAAKGAEIRQFVNNGLQSKNNSHWDSANGGSESGNSDPYDGWEELTKDKLTEYARGQAGHCDPCNDNELGEFFMDIFENNVSGMDGFRKAEFKRDKSTDGGIRNTVPDFTANASYNIGMRSRKVGGGVWYELKAKSGNLYRKTDKGGEFDIGQIEGHITNLAAKFAFQKALTKGRFQPALFIVTTADVGLSPVLRTIATGLGVQLHHIHAFYRTDKGGKWHFTFLPPKPKTTP